MSGAVAQGATAARKADAPIAQRRERGRHPNDAGSTPASLETERTRSQSSAWPVAPASRSIKKGAAVAELADAHVRHVKT